MSLETELRDFLLADTTLTAILTGGIYAWDEETNHNGISMTGTPAAYDEEGVLLPCAVVKAPDTQNWGGIRDRKVASQSTRVEIYVYDEGRNSRDSAVLPAYDRIVALTDAEFISGIGHIRHYHRLDIRDIDMSNALVTKADFQVVGVRG
jgi:hypothetical protein